MKKRTLARGFLERNSDLAVHGGLLLVTLAKHLKDVKNHILKVLSKIKFYLLISVPVKFFSCGESSEC